MKSKKGQGYIMAAATTPMMQQYFEIKEKYCDYLLMYRLGDFYELFYDDAILVSKEIELTLTGRDCGEGNRAPMCGVPFHKADYYIGRLVELGHKVAICEQTEDPALAKGLVKREVVRVVTPGTIIESTLLNDTKNNYLCSVYIGEGEIGVGFADISTGQVSATCFFGAGADGRLINELGAYTPSEAIINLPREKCPAVAEFLQSRLGALISDGQSVRFDEHDASQTVKAQFPSGNDASLNADKAVIRAVGALISYIKETQMTDLSYIKELNIYTSGQFLELDINTRRNLELVESMRTKEKRGSLLWVLDRTETAMGARLLRSRVLQPLLNPAEIGRRQAALRDLYDDYMLREELRELLSRVLDLERLTTKIVYGSANGKDLRAILASISVLPEVKSLISRLSSDEFKEICGNLDELWDIRSTIEKAIIEDPPFTVREGGIIADGYDADVDYLRSVMKNGKDWIADIEKEERETTGIKTLRIGYNRVFGYYLEVTKSLVGMVPERYIRKQTLSNCERYITQELKDMESTILGAADKLSALEYSLFQKIREFVAENSARIQTSAAMLAKTDVYLSLAEVAAKNRYVCPEVDYSDIIDIKDGRHPVVEQFVSESYFVPNDTQLDTNYNRLLLITGPNMAGKSTYMRQTALITLMAQIGSFVPASSARIGVVDKLFTRVGASDDLASGQSTFMLEMNEVAYILKNATKRSLIIYDEIGRGTSTYDGMSIARAVAEYSIGKKLGAKTMFATHYHELTSLEEEFEGVVNYNIAAIKRGDDITFLRKIVRGAADDSYGIEVAKLAGVPPEVIRRAKKILEGLEQAQPASHTETKVQEFDMLAQLQNSAANEIAEKIKKIDINILTPIEAMNLLFEFKKQL